MSNLLTHHTLYNYTKRVKVFSLVMGIIYDVITYSALENNALSKPLKNHYSNAQNCGEIASNNHLGTFLIFKFSSSMENSYGNQFIYCEPIDIIIH